MIYGYIRVSSDKQTVENQRFEINNFCKKNEMKIDGWIDFKVSEAWAILSDIEQSIKQKVEIVGTPLKDWDVEIYRGVLTGYNDAFIISSETRKEILDNCKSLDERQRTEEIIRPYLLLSPCV
ncbi:MAG: hypothetical protein E7114_08700 [Bacteroidales bacterium]|nr:hypothetical protein [Bacteroidales bacterium]